jgi:imidazolonepropionase-like amidohydrolase
VTSSTDKEVVSVSLELHGGVLIDGTGRDPIEDAVVRIEGERIVDVSAGAQAARVSDEVIELDGLTLLPGLIDLHSHMGVVATANVEAMSPAMMAAHLFRNSELCLMSGHTTAREVAGADGALREVIDLGLVPGPRLFPSGPMLSQSGGHGDHTPRFRGHEHHFAGLAGLTKTSEICDGVDGVRLAAREAFRQGATQLKVCISGGVVSLHDRIEDTQFTVAELKAAVEEAKARNTYVTAHAINCESIHNGLDAGLECFEHGSFLDERTAARMVQAGAALVPTMTVVHLLTKEWKAWDIPEAVLPRMQGLEAATAAAVKLAFEMGVIIGSGTDLLGPEQNRRGLEIGLKAGVIGPMAAIVSATQTSARILRRSDDLGTVEVGKLADVIAVDGDPLSDPFVFDRPDLVVVVIKGGRVVKDLRP